MTDLNKSPPVKNFTKISQVGAELFYVDGRTDGETEQTKLIVAFCNFAKALKNCELGRELLKHLSVVLS